MTQPVRLRLHVSEPFDFERHNVNADLFGTTRDHGDEDAGEWLIALESRFHFNEQEYDSVLVSPRYVGEPLRRVFDAMLGEPVRIAHRTPEGWHYAMTGMLSVAPPSDDSPVAAPDDPSGL